MNQSEIAKWHIQQGKDLAQRGKDLLKQAKAHFQMAHNLDVAVLPNIPTNDGTVTLQQIKEYLANNGGRIVHLARRFNVPESEIERLIKQENSGVFTHERGWLKLSSPDSTLD